MLSKDQAMRKLTAHPDLAEVLELAQWQTMFLIDLALTCDDPRWRVPDFALLKLYATRIVGPTANHPQLRTRRHEEVLHAFVDWLLPERGFSIMKLFDIEGTRVSTSNGKTLFSSEDVNYYTPTLYI